MNGQNVGHVAMIQAVLTHRTRRLCCAVVIYQFYVSGNVSGLVYALEEDPPPPPEILRYSKFLKFRIESCRIPVSRRFLESKS